MSFSNPVSRRVLVIGPGPDCRGGISAVLRTHSIMPVWFQSRCVWISTRCDGGLMAQMYCLTRAVLSAFVHTPRAAIVHVHTASNRSFYRKSIFVLIARLFGKKVLLHVHGGGFAGFCEGANTLERLLLRATMKGTSAVVALSRQMAESLSPYLPGKPIFIVPNTYSLEGCREASCAAAQPAILFASRIEPAKGVFDLLRAFAQVRRSLPGCRLTIAGDGDVQAAIHFARELGIGSATSFPGWLTGRELSGEFYRATVFCLPSYCEGVPTALLQAMEAGLPVVATAVGGVPEYIDSERTGLLVKPGDVDQLAAALIRLLSDPALRCRLAEAAKLRVASVSPEHINQLLTSVYEGI